MKTTLITSKIDWKAKLSSRKFWAFLAQFITSVLIGVNAGQDTIVKVVSIVSALGAVVIYLLVEGAIDKARVSNFPKILPFAEEDNTPTY